jgi:hypothetical protein
MHWLQSTYATRFNRLRAEPGHLFQGRYKSLVVRDAAVLVRLINYIHLKWTKTQTVVERDIKKARWKIEIATRLRRQAAAPYRWIAAALNMGNHESLRVYVCHQD